VPPRVRERRGGLGSRGGGGGEGAGDCFDRVLSFFFFFFFCFVCHHCCCRRRRLLRLGHKGAQRRRAEALAGGGGAAAKGAGAERRGAPPTVAGGNRRRRKNRSSSSSRFRAGGPGPGREPHRPQPRGQGVPRRGRKRRRRGGRARRGQSSSTSTSRKRGKAGRRRWLQRRQRQRRLLLPPRGAPPGVGVPGGSGARGPACPPRVGDRQRSGDVPVPVSCAVVRSSCDSIIVLGLGARRRVERRRERQPLPERRGEDDGRVAQGVEGRRGRFELLLLILLLPLSWRRGRESRGLFRRRRRRRKQRRRRRKEGRRRGNRGCQRRRLRGCCPAPRGREQFDVSPGRRCFSLLLSFAFSSPGKPCRRQRRPERGRGGRGDRRTRSEFRFFSRSRLSNRCRHRRRRRIPILRRQNGTVVGRLRLCPRRQGQGRRRRSRRGDVGSRRRWRRGGEGVAFLHPLFFFFSSSVVSERHKNGKRKTLRLHRPHAHLRWETSHPMPLSRFTTTIGEIDCSCSRDQERGRGRNGVAKERIKSSFFFSLNLNLFLLFKQKKGPPPRTLQAQRGGFNCLFLGKWNKEGARPLGHGERAGERGRVRVFL